MASGYHTGQCGSGWTHRSNELFCPWVSSMPHILWLSLFLNWQSQPSFFSLWLPDLISQERKGLLSQSLLMGLRLLHRQLSLWSQKTTTYTLCLYVHEGKPVAILKHHKLFLMGNIESAELKTQLCGSNGNVISSVSLCSLSVHCVQGSRRARPCRETSRGRPVHVSWMTFFVSIDSFRNLRGS